MEWINSYIHGAVNSWYDYQKWKKIILDQCIKLCSGGTLAIIFLVLKAQKLLKNKCSIFKDKFY